MKQPILMISLGMALGLSLAPAGVLAAASPALNDSTAALLIIDVQDFYFPGGAQPLDHPEAAAANARRLLAAFRTHGRLVVHVGHQVRAGGGFHPDVAPLPGELIVMKSEVNAFQGTDLLKLLREAGIQRLVICGMQTHMCLEGAVRAAADHGFVCQVIGDACATRDLARGELVVPAEHVHQATLATLDGIYAEVLATETFLGPE